MRLDEPNTMVLISRLYLYSIHSYWSKTVVTSHDLGWPFWEVTGQQIHPGCQEWPKLTCSGWNWVDSLSIHETGSIWIFPHWLIMGRSRNWPDLRSPIWKIRDIRFVSFDCLMNLWKFENIWLRTLGVARSQTFLEVGSRDPAWWPDLVWPEAKIFAQCAELMSEQLCQKRRRCAPPQWSRLRNETGPIGVYSMGLAVWPSLTSQPLLIRGC